MIAIDLYIVHGTVHVCILNFTATFYSKLSKRFCFAWQVGHWCASIGPPNCFSNPQALSKSDFWFSGLLPQPVRMEKGKDLEPLYVKSVRLQCPHHSVRAISRSCVFLTLTSGLRETHLLGATEVGVELIPIHLVEWCGMFQEAEAIPDFRRKNIHCWKEKKFPVAHSWSRKLKAAPRAISNCTSSTVHRIQNVSTQSNVKCHPSQDFQTIQLVRDSHPLSFISSAKVGRFWATSFSEKVQSRVDIGCWSTYIWFLWHSSEASNHYTLVLRLWRLLAAFYVLNIVFAQTHSLKYITASYSTWRLFSPRHMDMSKWTTEAPKLKIWPTKCV